MHYPNTEGITDQAKLDQRAREVAAINGQQTQLAGRSLRSLIRDPALGPNRRSIKSMIRPEWNYRQLETAACLLA
jgi:hypothetical protein